MYRLLLAMVTAGWLLVAPGLALGQQDKKPEAPPAKKEEMYVKVTKTWHDPDRVISVIGLAVMGLLLFYLIMIRSELEKLNSKSS